MEGDSLNDLRKFILKETHHLGAKIAQAITARDISGPFSQFFQAIPLYNKLKNLTTLVISRVSVFGRQGANGLASAIPALEKLKYLDVSYNNLSGYDLSLIIEPLYGDDACKLKFLNLSGNNAYFAEQKMPHGSAHPIDRFSDRVQRLLKSSLHLQHLDLSCL